MRRIFVLSFLGLVSCAPSYTWQNPTLSPAVADQQLAIDKAECTAYGIQSVPVPNRTPNPVPAAPPAPNYTTSTIVPFTDMYGNVVGANVETYQNYGTHSALDSAAQAQSNWQATQDDARVNEAYQAQDQMAEACMIKRGWQKVATSQ